MCVGDMTHVCVCVCLCVTVYVCEIIHVCLFVCMCVQILQKRFTDFVHNTMASEERVTHVCRMADTLIEASHTGKTISTPPNTHSL